MRFRGICSGTFAALAIAMLVGACTKSESENADAHEHQVVGFGRTVTVLYAGTEEHARPFAEEYCQGLGGKTAEFRQITTHRLDRYATARDVEFECVAAHKS